MWTDLLIYLLMLFALVAVAAVIWVRRGVRKQDAKPDQSTQSSGGKGEE